MPRRLTEREKRRRKIRRRRRLVMTGIILVLALVVVLIVFIIKLTIGLVGNIKSNSSSKQPQVTTTTTYPTLDATAVDSVLYMNNVVLYDATHDTILYSKNADDICYPASLTKMLTAIVSCKYCDPNTTFTIGSEQNLKEWDASCAYLQEDQAYSLREVLQGLLLPSGADAAYVLAANIPRIHENNPGMSDQDAINTFVGYMNTVAQEIGCTNSQFVTPDGYHDMYHYTTANDMLKIARYAMSFDMIKQVVSTQKTDNWINGNRLIDPSDPYYYPYANGIKTGYTDEAGFCLAAHAERNGVELYAILICSTSDEYRFVNAADLFEMGFNLAEHPPTTTTAFHDYFDYFNVETRKS